jgi:hypothetical protein
MEVSVTNRRERETSHALGSGRIVVERATRAELR